MARAVAEVEREKPWVLADAASGRPVARLGDGYLVLKWHPNQSLWFRDRDDFVAWRVALEFADPYQAKRYALTIVRRTWWRVRWWRAKGAFKNGEYIPGFLMRRINAFVATLAGFR